MIKIKSTYSKLAGIVALVGVAGSLGYSLIVNREHGKIGRMSAVPSQVAEHERSQRVARRSQDVQDTNFVSNSGSVDLEKLNMLVKNVDRNSFEQLFRRIYECRMNNQDKCNLLTSISGRMVMAGESELVRSIFDEIKPTGYLRQRLLLAIFQDPTKSMASLMQDQRKFVYDDESRAALAGMTEKMRGKGFDQAELFRLPKLNDRESLAIANGIAMGYGNAVGDEARAAVFRNGIGLLGKLIEAGILEENARTGFLGSSSLVVPFETWESLVKLQAEATDASKKLLKQALGMNVVGLIKVDPEAGMDLVASSFSTGQIDESVFRTGISTWIGRDIELASRWIERNASNQQVADLACAEMYKHCMSVGDQATAEQWRRLVNNPDVIPNNPKQEVNPTAH